jgi:hypothetical protein
MAWQSSELMTVASADGQAAEGGALGIARSTAAIFFVGERATYRRLHRLQPVLGATTTSSGGAKHPS